MPSSPPPASAVPKLGPEPTLLSRKEVDALYETLQAITSALQELKVDYIVTGGSLLGAIRQHSLLFCDDDIDVTIIDYPKGHPMDPYPHATQTPYQRVSDHLAKLLGTSRYTYSIRPWEAGDKVRPKFMSSVFVDIFTLRRFDSVQELEALIGVKTNGQPQPQEYIQNIRNTIETIAYAQGEATPLCPFWHFNTRKAVELWPKEVYREKELFPLDKTLHFGPLTKIQGPKMPVLLLKRAFGMDCFEVYYPSESHKDTTKAPIETNNNKNINKEATTINDEGKEAPNCNNNSNTQANKSSSLPPRTLAGGIWEHSKKQPLEDVHYLPMQPTIRAKRRPTLHCKQQLLEYLEQHSELETTWQREHALQLNLNPPRPRRTVYLDGVFDMFHIGHLQAIQQCAALGDRVIIGVVSDEDAVGYKRPPMIPQDQRVAIVAALRLVDKVICPNPFVVTEAFMKEHDIDLVVHGFADDADAERQREFFEEPMRLGKFKTIRYYKGLSTTDILAKIQGLSVGQTSES